jgi:hypothetical protein
LAGSITGSNEHGVSFGGPGSITAASGVLSLGSGTLTKDGEGVAELERDEHLLGSNVGEWRFVARGCRGTWEHGVSDSGGQRDAESRGLQRLGNTDSWTPVDVLQSAAVA